MAILLDFTYIDFPNLKLGANLKNCYLSAVKLEQIIIQTSSFCTLEQAIKIAYVAWLTPNACWTHFCLKLRSSSRKESLSYVLSSSKVHANPSDL